MSQRYRSSAPLAGAVLVVALGVAAHAPLRAQTASDAAPASAPAQTLQIGEVEMSGTVVSIDAASNTVTLRGARRMPVTITVDPTVGDVSKLKPGDHVNMLYKEALLLRADKVSTRGIRSRVDTVATTPASGGLAATARSVQVVATVEKIDRKSRKVALRGPTRTVVVVAPPDVPLENIKVGDSVRADYVSATAVEVTRNGQRLQ
jgi:Cu/Ag efflux protein CusF